MSYVNAAMAVVKVGGALAQGRADRMNANTQAMEDDYQATQEEQAAQQQADIIRRARGYAVGRADAGYAASGVVVGEGSAAVTDAKIINDSTQDAYNAILTGQRRGNALRAGGQIAAIGGVNQSTQDDLRGLSGALQSGYAGISNWKTMNPAPASGTGGEF